MSEVQTQIGTISYNPARSAFEALVTFHTPAGPHRVAAQCDAPLGADFADVSEGLLVDALARIARPGALKSSIGSAASAMERPSPCEPRKAA